MKKLFVLLQCLLLSISTLFAADIITVGTGSSEQYVPYGSSNYTTTQFILTKDEIGRSGRITALSFYQIKYSSNGILDGLKIYMGHTTASTISASSPFTSSDLTLVYNVRNYLGESTGWIKHNFKMAYCQPFSYNGTDNLVVVVCHQPDDKSYSQPVKAQTTSKSNSCISRTGTASTYVDLASTSGYSLSSYRPNVKLEMEYFEQGAGTEANPFIIKDVNDLDYLSNLVNSGTGSFASMYYKLDGDINYYGGEYTPIGTMQHPFTGNFDGNGYSIKGLNFSLNGAVDYAGIFGVASRATIKNLTFADGGSVNNQLGKIVGTLCSGAICAYADYNTIIQNCKNIATSVSISGSDANSRAGGICGVLMDGSVVRECINSSAVSGPCAGGLVGYNTDGFIFTSYNTGTISGTSYSGGIAGINYHDDGGGYIYSCLNVGTISSGTTKGNIFGRNSSGIVGNCYWNNSITVGANSEGTVQDCSKKDLTTGEVAYLLRTKSYSMFTYKDISGDVWRQNLGSDSYPVLDSSHSMVYLVNHKCCANNTSNITKEYKNSSLDIIDNNLTSHSAVSASCTSGGSIAYYSCNKCGKKYTTSPSSSSSEVSNVSTSPLGHSLVKTEGKDPTPTTSGNHPYWRCTRCNKYFSNSAGTTETTVAAQTIGACPWHYPTYNVPSSLFASGSGFSDDPYLISSAQELANMAYFVNTTASVTHTDQLHEMSVYFYKLTNDINLEEYEWTPIGLTSFVGQFDGNNHTVSGLKITGTTNSNVGLFSNTGRDGYLTTIEKLTVKGSVSGNKQVGGIVGYMQNTTIRNCVSECTVAGSQYVGGIAGYMYYQANSTGVAKIEKSTSQSATGISGSSYVGGIAGYGMARCQILSCNNISKVTASTQCAGGIYGYVTESDLKASFNRGTISGANSGALIGKMEKSGGSIQYNYYLESASSNAIGIKPSGYAPNNVYFVVYESATASQFQSGEIAYNMNWGDGEWYQNIGSDSYPVLDATHGTVYEVEIHCCTNGSHIERTYSNANGGVHYVNNLTAHPATTATCTTSGNKAYWTCNTCGKAYTDANATTETTEAAQTIPATGHSLVKTEAKEATCTTSGNRAYWTCSTCGKVFSDANATTETTVAAQTIAAGHVFNSNGICTRCGYDKRESIVTSGRNLVDISFSTNHEYEWYSDGGSYIWSSNNGEHDTDSETTITIVPKCNVDLSFWGTVSSEKNFDELFISLDGVVLVDGISGYDDYYYSIYLKEGKAYEIELRYSKDESDSEGDDKAGFGDFDFVVHTHSYGAPTWNWASDGKSATAAFTCVGGEDTQTMDATITSTVKIAATCTTMGTTTYTAKVTFGGNDYTSTKDVQDIDLTDHDFSSGGECSICHMKNEITLNDSEDYTQAEQIENVNVVYTRNFKNTGWQALYVPFAMNYEDWKDDFDVAYIEGFLSRDLDNDGTIDETTWSGVMIKAGTILPNTPYLIRAKSTGEKTITLNDATLYAAEINSIDCSSTTMKYEFIGQYESESFGSNPDDYPYYINNGTFSKVPRIIPFRWIMRITSRGNSFIQMPNMIKGMVRDDDGSTFIEYVERHQDKFTGCMVFSIDGRMIDYNEDEPLKPGLYIKNGKKILVR